MYIEEYGKGNKKTIVMLHGAFFIHTFGRQYCLADKYHLIVPHLPGFGNHTEKVFNAGEAIAELTELIPGIGSKVTLVGFSLGAQLAYELLCESPELFDKAIIVSPWLVKSKDEMDKMIKINEKQFTGLQNKFQCSLIAIMNGLPKAQREEFVRQMQHVRIETVHNAVNNGIELSEQFKNVQVPVVALAGGKESKGVVESVKQLAKLNRNCRVEIWPKAAHNIPPVFAKRFNKLIEREFEET